MHEALADGLPLNAEQIESESVALSLVRLHVTVRVCVPVPQEAEHEPKFPVTHASEHCPP